MDRHPFQLAVNVVILLIAGALLAARFQGFRDYRPGGALGVRIGVKDYGARWPFQFDRGALMCPDWDEVILRDPESGRSYSLTQAALNSGAGWPAYQAVIRSGTSDEIIPELIQRGLKHCPLSGPGWSFVGTG